VTAFLRDLLAVPSYRNPAMSEPSCVTVPGVAPVVTITIDQRKPIRFTDPAIDVLDDKLAHYRARRAELDLLIEAIEEEQRLRQVVS
jgi:hypothetical protein